MKQNNGIYSNATIDKTLFYEVETLEDKVSRIIKMGKKSN